MTTKLTLIAFGIAAFCMLFSLFNQALMAGAAVSALAGIMALIAVMWEEFT